MTSEHVKICFTLDPDDWHGTPSETLWAKPIHDVVVPSAFELDNTPFHAMGVSYRDLVRAVMRDGMLEFAGVIAHGGHSTYRVFREQHDDTFRAWWDRLKAVGCTREWGEMNGGILYAIDVPPETDIYAVRAILEEGKTQNVWYFEEGHVGHPLGDAPVRPAES